MKLSSCGESPEQSAGRITLNECKKTGRRIEWPAPKSRWDTKARPEPHRLSREDKYTLKGYFGGNTAGAL